MVAGLGLADVVEDHLHNNATAAVVQLLAQGRL
jgi:hypothetical protein